MKRHHRKFTAFHWVILAVAVAAFIALAVSQRLNDSEDPAGQALLGPQDQAWLEFSNDLYAFRAAYPETYDPDDDYVYLKLGEDEAIPGVAFRLPETATRSAGLTRDSYFSVEILPLFNDCTALQFSRGTLEAEILEEDGRTYSVARSRVTDEAGTYEETVYSLPGEMYCYGLRSAAGIPEANPLMPDAEFNRTYLEEMHRRFRQQFEPR